MRSRFLSPSVIKFYLVPAAAPQCFSICNERNEAYSTLVVRCACVACSLSSWLISAIIMCVTATHYQRTKNTISFVVCALQQLEMSSAGPPITLYSTAAMRNVFFFQFLLQWDLLRLLGQLFLFSPNLHVPSPIGEGRTPSDPGWFLRAYVNQVPSNCTYFLPENTSQQIRHDLLLPSIIDPNS